MISAGVGNKVAFARALQPGDRVESIRLDFGTVPAFFSPVSAAPIVME